MDSSAAKDQINTSDLTVVLRELRDSIRNQTTLLEAIITEQRTLRDAPKSSHKSSQSPSSNRSHGDDKDDDAACEDSQTIQKTEELDDPSALARRLWPLFHDRVTFWRVGEELEESLSGGTYILPDLLSLLDKTTPLGPCPKRGVVGNCWKYWTPIFTGPLGGSTRLIHSRGGHPDYVPPWELRKIKDQLFHIDDIHQKDPIPFPEKFTLRELIIPYSFTPPTSSDHLWPLHQLATTGITQDWGRMHSCLGDLYAVPPDNRIPLTFEKNELRLKCASGKIDAYLGQMCKTFKVLDSKGGFFIIEDYDMYGHAALYSWRSASKSSDWSNYTRSREIRKDKLTVDQPSYWQAAGPSLSEELSGLEVAPEIYESFPRNLNTKDNVLCTVVSNRTRSWFRIIHFRGLAELGGSWDEIRNLLLIEEPPMHRFNDPTRQAFYLHFTCDSTPKRGNPFKNKMSSRPFHITWHAVVSAHRQRHYGQTWKYGRLYGTEDYLIRETAFTMAIVPVVSEDPVGFRCLPDNRGYWTILLLTSSIHPIHTTHSAHGLNLIKQAIDNAITAWEYLDRHFRLILDNHDTVFNPEEHDHLLFDDDTFSRSRRYFWVMDSLEVFIPEIKNTILEWEYFWEEKEPVFRMFEEESRTRRDNIAKVRVGPPYVSGTHINDEVDNILSRIVTLKEYQARFEAYQARTRTLREGLFNASSVIESRAATRLGENVKLLTYVSIFYLPLAFCVGIWSINENYGRVSLVMASVLVAAGTYFIVGNLENTIGALKAIYRAFKRPIVDRMAKDHDQTWSERGRAFQSFQPRREIVKPSEWYIAQYWGMEILRKLKVRRGTLEGLRETNEHAAPSPDERSQRMPSPPSAPNAGDGNVHPEPQPQSQPGTKVDKGKRKATVVSPV